MSKGTDKGELGAKNFRRAVTVKPETAGKHARVSSSGIWRVDVNKVLKSKSFVEQKKAIESLRQKGYFSREKSA